MNRLGMRFRFLRGIVFSFVAIFLFSGIKAFALSNVLDAIQINGVKDSYEILLKSDKKAILNKTIQAPNKMILNLKGIRASKTINTIYNNAATVDNVVVEPIGQDEIKISIQAQNVNNALVKFDTIDSPLGLLNKQNVQEKEIPTSITLNKPINTYKPVYEEEVTEEIIEPTFSENLMASSQIKELKNFVQDENFAWLVAFGLIGLVIVNGVKSIKGKDSEIKVGLSQGLKQRELGLSRNMQNDMNLPSMSPIQTVQPQSFAGTTGAREQIVSPLAGVNYGLKAYEKNTRSPYMSAENQRTKRVSTPVPSSYDSLSSVSRGLDLKSGAKNPVLSKAPASNPLKASAKKRSANIDSIKFLESMTKIYEKNGRADLAQGLKSNMKKAKATIA